MLQADSDSDGTREGEGEVEVEGEGAGKRALRVGMHVRVGGNWFDQADADCLKESRLTGLAFRV
jgi:hypothetical protein